MQFPVITIVTITFNNLSGLKKTLKSVHDQTFTNFEHWVIDGNSSDDTLSFLKGYLHHSLHFISEADRGIYDAMNKGIDRATGDWIIFMNAGDCFASPQVLEMIDFNTHTDLIYGDSKICYENGFERIQRASSTSTLWKGMSFTHQAVFVRRALVKKIPFDLNYRYCSDFNQIFTFYVNNKNFTQLDLVIAEIEAGGVSDSKRYRATREVYLINKKLHPKFRIHPYFITKIVKGFLVVKLKSLLPKKFRSYLLKKKYQSAT